MSSTARQLLMLLVLLSLALFTAAEPGKEASPAPASAKLDLESAGQLAFGPDDVLFIADSLGTAVYAVELADRGKPSAGEMPPVEDVDEKVAALVGTTARDVLIHDLAVHPTSRNVYLSVSRGRGDDAEPVIVKVDGTGALSLVEVGEARFTKAMIGNAPAADAKTRRGSPMRPMTITDIAFAGGHLYVAGLSNEEFASNLRKIPYPFTGEMSATSVEIYHGAHGKYETHAPIRTLMPYEIEGEPHLLAAYTCTPLVTFPLAELEDGAHLKGTTVAELGYGNRPLDMIQFNKKGDPYILILNSSRGGMRIDPVHLKGAKGLGTETEITRDAPTAGVPYVTVPMGGILRADNLDDDNLMILARDLDTGSLVLQRFPTTWL